jgi:hypothetical protein
MKYKAFWITFVVVEGAAAILAHTFENPQGHPVVSMLPTIVIALVFPLTLICLFPGILISAYVLNALRFASGDRQIITVAILLNAVIWHATVLAVSKVRSKIADAGKRSEQRL